MSSRRNAFKPGDKTYDVCRREAQEDGSTKFALARVVTGWSDYFLQDEETFGPAAPELFVPPVPVRDLFAFQLLPALTEASLVNLAIGSGLLAHALEIDELTAVPATGQSTFDFTVVPHRELDVQWDHVRGQVELDALFIARRSGRETLFVVEAK